MQKEEPSQQAPITLTFSHDAVAALGSASLHYRTWVQGNPHCAATLALCDEIYRVIMQHPQVSLSTKALLRDTRLLIAGQRETYEGAMPHAHPR